MPLQPAVLGTARLNNFRLNYLTADQAADRPTKIRILLGGVDNTGHVIYKSLTIRDVLFEAPNTCALTLYGASPNVGQPIEVWINSNAPQLLFNGEIQTVDKTYKGRPTTVLHPVTAIDDTARANRRRPLRPYVNVSATTIAQDLIATYAPGFSSAGVEAGLPIVTINFDGSEGGMKGCLTALAKLVGGYWFFENKTLYLFVTPPGTPPDPIDDTPGRFLHDPAITWTIDKSQVRTRVYGKGASTRIAASLNANEAIVPLENAEMFTATGGQAIAGTTPEGAASRVLTYTGVQSGGGGGLVGPGAAPAAAPTLALADGAGVESGVHAYAYSFVTAAGSSLPSPLAAITVGPMAPPAAAPVPSTVSAGGAVDAGSHTYALTFVTAIGETTGSPVSAPVTTSLAGLVPAPTVAPSCQSVLFAGHLDYPAGSVMTFRYAFVNAAGVTTPTGLSNAVTAVVDPDYGAPYVKGIELAGLQVSTDPTVTGKRIYQYRNGAFQGSYVVPAGLTVFIDGQETLEAIPPSGTNTATSGANYQTVRVTGIAIGPANVTTRRLYRSSNGAPFKLVDTFANDPGTAYTDTKASAALGPVLPTTNTALANRVAVTVPVSASSQVIGRNVYRTTAGGTQLKYATAWADNTTTSWVDGLADAALGANAPTSDASGLTQPAGQVPAGAPTLIVATSQPFAAGGGWAIIGNGAQVIRYTAKTATNLTGIPATGPGAIVASISYNSTVTAAPALVGVVGLLDAVIRNAPIHVWVQRDDLEAQAYMAALDGGGDGVYEHIWSDERRSEASLRQVCDAQLVLYSRPLVTVTYATRDLKTKSGKTVTIALATPAIQESLTIQDVQITELGIKGLAPKFTVTASSVRQSLENILQLLIRKADA